MKSLEHLNTLKNIEWDVRPKHISLFSGCGGLDLPLHYAGFELTWANDFNQFACETFKNNISDNIYCGSIEDVDIGKLPDADIVTGGFPCQDFSIIWKRDGLNGSRGNLYTYLLEMVNKKKPKVFIAENVKGLLSANDGKAIQQIIEDFQSIDPGYIIKPKLYNFADFGVPQLRERVILVGIRMDTGFNFIHPKPKYGKKTEHPYVSSGEALENVELVIHNNEHQNIKEKTKKTISLISQGGNFKDIPQDSEYYVKGKLSLIYRRLHKDKPSSTIIAAGGGGTWGYHYDEHRPLTNRERARLQGFPDDFVFSGSITEVRRQIGNAVPPVGAASIIRELIPLFKGEYSKVDLYTLDKRLKEMNIRDRLKFSQEETPDSYKLLCYPEKQLT
jgi:DNA (cytosine-5)-methyltransferase 1